MALTLEREHIFQQIKKRKRYKVCFGRLQKKIQQTKLVLPLEREHRNARRKESDCEMYEGVRKVMSKHDAKTFCFYVQT